MNFLRIIKVFHVLAIVFYIAFRGIRQYFLRVLRQNIFMKFICLLIPLFLCSLVGCVEYHPYDMKTDGQRSVNSTNISKIEKICDGRTSIRFAVVSDSQRWYDELDKIVGAINGCDNIDFVIHAGDLTDFGLKTEFERQRDILNKLEIPYVYLIGNHDCIAMGKSLYYRIFGNPDFSFVAGNVKFLCLNTNMLEYRDDANRAVFSLRQICAPFDCPIGERSSFEPLLCGTYVTLVTGARFWTQEPSKYGGDYYRFSSRVRLHAFVGQRLNFLAGTIKTCKLSLYCEVGACDLNLISKFTNRKLRFSDIVSFSFGVRVQPDLSRLVKGRQ